MSATPTYNSWVQMNRRCTDPRVEQFPRYGGRGIAVCESWRHSFEAFLAVMGERPNGTTLGRIDGDKGYDPSNCRWETPQEQNNNRSTNTWTEFRGDKKTTAQWAREFGIPYKVMLGRRDLGWSMDRVSHTPYAPRALRNASRADAAVAVAEDDR